MPRRKVRRGVLAQAKTAALALIVCGTGVTSTFAEIVDLHTSPIDHGGHAARPFANRSARVRQVQALSRLPPILLFLKVSLDAHPTMMTFFPPWMLILDSTRPLCLLFSSLNSNNITQNLLSLLFSPHSLRSEELRVST